MRVNLEAPPPGSADPLYLQVARSLMGRIRDGVYPVGTLLPAETELAQALGVSRQTLRQGLAELRDVGLISARRGVGTRVESARIAQRFSYALKSIDDLASFASRTSLSLVSRERFVGNEAMSDRLGIPVGTRWLHAGCLRRTLEDGQPFCWTDIYIAERYGELLSDPIATPIFADIEKREGRQLTEVHQEIRGVVLGPVAERLDASTGAPGLEISRRYFLGADNLVEVSVNTIPSDRYHFTLALDLTR